MFDATSVRRDLLRSAFAKKGVAPGEAAKAAGILTIPGSGLIGRVKLASRITHMSATNVLLLMQKCGVTS